MHMDGVKKKAPKKKKAAPKKKAAAKKHAKKSAHKVSAARRAAGKRSPINRARKACAGKKNFKSCVKKTYKKLSK